MRKKEEKERTRREYATAGSRNQRMMAFRLDNENAEWLKQKPNKGRYINELIQADRKKRGE